MRAERRPRSSQRPGCLARVHEDLCPALAPTFLPVAMQGKVDVAVFLPLLPGNGICGAAHLMAGCSPQEQGRR